MIGGVALMSVAMFLSSRLYPRYGTATSIAQYQAIEAAMASYGEAASFGVLIFFIGALWLLFKGVLFILRRKY